MPPAAECSGCGMKWKTTHEPAMPEEMDSLLTKVALHGLENGLAVAKGMLDGRNESVHKVRIKFHETTPSEGFAEAEVLSAKS